MSKNIQMTENTGSGYENIYPKTLRSLVERSVSNASSLGGESASNYLKKTEGCTLENLSVYINTLTTATTTTKFSQKGSFNTSSLPCLQSSMTTPYLYQGHVLSTFSINVGANFGTADVTITLTCIKKTDISSGKSIKFTTRSEFGQYIYVADSSFLKENEQKTLIFSTNSKISGIYAGYWNQTYSGYYDKSEGTFLVSSGDNSYVQSLEYVTTFVSSQQTVSDVQPQIKQWINQTQYYSNSQFLLDKWS